MTGFTFPWSQADHQQYTDDFWAQYISILFGFGSDDADRGVVKGTAFSADLEVVGDSTQSVEAAEGAAMIKGRLAYFDGPTNVALAPNSSGNPRIDLIVAEYDEANLPDPTQVTVVQGTPAASPVAPSPVQSATKWQIPLAEVLLVNGYTVTNNDVVTDRREYMNIPDSIYIPIVNTSGAIRKQGELVVWDAAANRAVTTTTTEGAKNVAGVVEARIASSGAGRIVVLGLAYILCDEAVAKGDLLEAGATAGQAQIKGTTSQAIPFGRVVVANSGAGTRCLAYINVPAWQEEKVYDSGWFAVTVSTVYTKAHGIGFRPKRIELFHSATGGTDEWVRVTQNGDGAGANYDCLGVDATNVSVATGTGAVGKGTASNRRRDSNGGFYRIFARE